MRITSGVLTLGFANVIPVIVLVYLGIINVGGVVVSPLTHSILGALTAAMGLLFAWYAYRGVQASGSLRLLIIGTGVLLASLLELGHSLAAYTYVEWQQAFWYGRLSHLVVAVTFFLAGGLDERIYQAGRRAGAVIVTTLIALFLLALFALSTEVVLSRRLLESITQSEPVMRFLQLAAIILLSAAFIRFLYGAFVVRSEIALLFAVSIFLFTMSELTFAGIVRLYDLQFWVAHLWTFLGYFTFLVGILVASRTPHVEGLKTSVPPPMTRSPVGRAPKG